MSTITDETFLQNVYKSAIIIPLVQNIILQLYNVSHSLWSHRNDIVHDNFDEKLNRKELDKLQKEITNEYRE